MNKKILIITSKFPWPITGASEQDRAEGIKQFLRLGFDVQIITKVSKEKIDTIGPVAKELAVPIHPFPYRYVVLSKISALKKYFKFSLTQPFLLDSAAFEYADPELVAKFKELIVSWKPDIVWFDMTFMWPLVKYINNKDIFVITRSQNNEAKHFLEEEGRGFLNYLIYLTKLISEYQTARLSNLVFAITPNEKEFYQRMRTKRVVVLPLRGLPRVIKIRKEIKDGYPLNVFFAGSTYNVKHNKKALLFIIRDIAPKVHKLFPNKFIFNIFGSKFPDDYKKYLDSNIIYKGFIDDYEAEMNDMDIAVVPSFSGKGMQQKIFEPLARGIPTITSPRGLQGYPFKDKEHLMFAKDLDGFISTLKKLLAYDIRLNLSKNAIKLSNELFSQEEVNRIITDTLKSIR